MPFGFGGNQNPFGKYSLPNVLGRLFGRDHGPGPVTRTQFPVSPVFNMDPPSGQLFNPGVNYNGYGGGQSGWVGQQTGGYGSGGLGQATNPFGGTGYLDGLSGGSNASGSAWGAFTPNQGAYGSGPTGGMDHSTNAAGFHGGDISLSEYGRFSQNNAGESAIRNMQRRLRT